ncbi:MAG TPA: hypothetical protein VK171_01750 [Fimbriimonas sp.]|nr:hypothetical protein [Fimbriimonas sp.]
MKLRTWLVAPLLLILLYGCSGQDASVAQVPVQKGLSLITTEYSEGGVLKLPRNRKNLRLGASEEEALNVFPRPSRGFPIDEAIPGFPSEYKAHGWEGSDDGFGVILRDGRTYLAMYEKEAMTADDFAEILEQVRVANNLDRFSAISKNGADYWFTKEGEEVIVLSRIAGLQKRYQVTVTLGHIQLVKALGILKDELSAQPYVR